jgi:hypothetical protein
MTKTKAEAEQALTRKNINALVKAQQAYVWAARKVVKGTTFYPDNTKRKTVAEQVAENEAVIHTINEWVVSKC